MRDGSFLGGFSWAPHGPVVIADPAVFPSQDTGKENESLILLFVCLSLFLSLSGRESSPQNLPADFSSGALVRMAICLHPVYRGDWESEGFCVSAAFIIENQKSCSE